MTKTVAEISAMPVVTVEQTIEFRALVIDRIKKLEGDIQYMVAKAAANHLPAYREQGQKIAELEGQLSDVLFFVGSDQRAHFYEKWSNR